MKLKRIFLIVLTTLFILSCNKEEVADDEAAIVGQWFLTAVNDTNVSEVECYQESYIRSDGETINFYILDRLEDGSCELVLNESNVLTIEDDFYYLGEEAIEIYIEGNELSWRVNFETTLYFTRG